MKSIIKYIPSVIIPTIFSIINIFIYGNYLTKDEYGKYNLYNTTISIIDVVFFSFITLSIIRFYFELKSSEEKDRLISTYMVTILIIMCILSILGWTILGYEAIYLIIGCFGFSMFSFYSNLLRAENNVRLFTSTKIIIPLSGIFILLYYINTKGKLDISNIIISTYFPYIFVNIGLTIKYLYDKRIKLLWDYNLIKSTLKFGSPLLVVGLLNLILSSSDKYFIKFFLGDSQLGSYSFAYRISELSMLNVTHIIIIALYPEVVKAYESYGKKQAEVLMKKFIHIHLIFIIPLIFCFFLFSSDILKIFFPQYIGSEFIIKLVSIGTFFYSISFYTNKAFEVGKNTKKMMFALLISVIINILLNWILIPRIGVLGAIYSTIISYFLYIILSMTISKDIFRILFDEKYVFYILILNIIIYFLILVIRKAFYHQNILTLIAQGILYFVLYIIGIYILIRVKKINIFINKELV
ncbi:hypothetical protein SDC9_105802 [bioreactor metagenome]|uniref:Uncharacterized protein n=1 Tax=bioreactor metagenome TaxID=1076179 RepID=A0A645B0L3_9ZZZZ